MRLSVEMSQGKFTEEMIGLFGARYDVRLILAVVEVCSSTQTLVFLSLGELLQLCQDTRKLVAIESAFDLFVLGELKKRVVKKKGSEVSR